MCLPKCDAGWSSWSKRQGELSSETAPPQCISTGVPCCHASHVGGSFPKLTPAPARAPAQVQISPRHPHASCSQRGWRGSRESGGAAWRRDCRQPETVVPAVGRETPPLSPRFPRRQEGLYATWSSSCSTPLPPPWLRERGVPSCQTVRSVRALWSSLAFSAMRRGDTEGKDHIRRPCLLIRTPYPHDAGQLRMPGHTHLDRAIDDGRSRTLRLLQRVE
jgi:hypothetical protein